MIRVSFSGVKSVPSEGTRSAISYMSELVCQLISEAVHETYPVLSGGQVSELEFGGAAVTNLDKLDTDVVVVVLVLVHLLPSGGHDGFWVVVFREIPH